MLEFEMGDFQFLDKKEIIIRAIENNFDKFQEAYSRYGLNFNPKTIEEANPFFLAPELAMEMFQQTYVPREYKILYQEGGMGDSIEFFVFSPKNLRRDRYEIDGKFINYIK